MDILSHSDACKPCDALSSLSVRTLTMGCYAGAVTAASFIFMRETSAVIILKDKATRLRKETGNPNLRAKGDKQTPISRLIAHAITRPATFLVLSCSVSDLSLH